MVRLDLFAVVQRKQDERLERLDSICKPSGPTAGPRYIYHECTYIHKYTHTHDQHTHAYMDVCVCARVRAYQCVCVYVNVYGEAS